MESRWTEAVYEIAAEHADKLSTCLGVGTDDLQQAWKDRFGTSGQLAALEWLEENSIPATKLFAWINTDWSDGPFNELSNEGRIEQASRAQAIAVIAHRGQVDKAGNAYISHPMAVAMKFDPIDDTLECCAAWLHDVVEDTDITHNTDPERMAQLDPAVRAKLEAKYRHALDVLGEPWPNHILEAQVGWSEFGCRPLWDMQD